MEQLFQAQFSARCGAKLEIVKNQECANIEVIVADFLLEKGDFIVIKRHFCNRRNAQIECQSGAKNGVNHSNGLISFDWTTKLPEPKIPTILDKPKFSS